jgi:hypothetical protein
MFPVIIERSMAAQTRQKYLAAIELLRPASFYMSRRLDGVEALLSFPLAQAAHRDDPLDSEHSYNTTVNTLDDCRQMLPTPFVGKRVGRCSRCPVFRMAA